MDAPEPINSLVYTRVNTHHVTRYSGAAAGRGDWQPLDQPRTSTARLYPYNHPPLHWLWCRQPRKEAAEPQRRIEGEDSREAEYAAEGSQDMGGAEVSHRQRCIYHV